MCVVWGERGVGGRGTGVAVSWEGIPDPESDPDPDLEGSGGGVLIHVMGGDALWGLMCGMAGAGSGVEGRGGGDGVPRWGRAGGSMSRMALLFVSTMIIVRLT